MAQEVNTYLIGTGLGAQIITPPTAGIVTVFVFMQGGLATLAYKDSTGAIKTLNDSTTAPCKFV